MDSLPRKRPKTCIPHFWLLIGFAYRVSQLEARLKTWGARKNLKPEEWKPVLDTLERLPKGTKSRVVIGSYVAPTTQISRARKYYRDKSRNSKCTEPPVSAQPANLASSASSSSPQSRQVRIEVLDSNEEWVELSETNILELRSISPATGRGPRDINTFVPHVLESTPTIPNQLAIGTQNDQTPLNPGISLSGPLQDSTPSIPILIGHPSTWLGQLPSRRLVKAVADINPSQYVQVVYRNAVIELNGAESPFGPSSLDSDTPNIRPTDQGYQFQMKRKQNQSIMAPDHRCRLKFIEYLLTAITSGMYKLNDIAGDVLDGCLGSDGALGSFLLSCFQAAPKYLAEILASSLFQAAICRGKLAVVAQFLEEGLGHVNDSIIVFHQDRYTPSEIAAWHGDEALLDLLLSHKADPNKTHGSSGGTLLACLWGRYDDQPSLTILSKLFEAGAIVPPAFIDETDFLDDEIVYFISTHILPSQHAEFVSKDFWTLFIPYCDDKTGAHLVNQFLCDCSEHHSGQCISLYQEKIQWGLVSVASKGHAATFLAILSHCNSLVNTLRERLLSASIRGKDPTIINFAMSMGPNVNPQPHSLRPPDPDEDETEVGTTPLAEAIKARNAEFLDSLLNSNILNSLHEGGRFEVAVEAAAETRDSRLVAHLLDSCPDLESHSLARALRVSIAKGHEEVALMLLERGASLYTGKYDYTRRSYNELYFLTAIETNNLLVMRDSLLLGESRYGRPYQLTNDSIIRHLKCLRDLSVAQNYLSSFHGNFRYEINNAVALDDLAPNAPEWQANGSPRRYLFKYLLPALRDEKMSGLILESKLATVQFLTLCLAVAVSQNDAKLAQTMVNKGANAADNIVLACAIRWHPNIFPVLIDGSNRKRNFVTKGLRTNVLKDAIMQGPTRARLVSFYVKSRSVDIFDTGPLNFDNGPNSCAPVLTPLGVAIGQVTAFPQYSYNIVKLLLDHGCDPNSIVLFDEERGPHINKTALVQAVTLGNQKLVQLLIARGAHVNQVLRHMVRRTPLQQAAEKGDLKMAKLLIEHGADVNAEPCIAMGGTALQLAAISGNCELAAELLQHGALLHMPPPKIGGRWPIEGAAEHGRLDMIQFLVRYP